MRARHFKGSQAVQASIQVSRYLYGHLVIPPSFDQLIQLENNPVNWPLYGKFPFIGDYIEIAADRTIMADASSPYGWRFFGTKAADDNEAVVYPRRGRTIAMSCPGFRRL